jgi:aspartyl-tRNA(Asn)/glutamyl-tRNA(Gln) amidotransferase subunit A
MIKSPPFTIRETQTSLLNKEFSAVNLVDSYLDRISKYNKKLNIILTITEERAYKKAKEVDMLISNMGEKAFEEFPLLGVVVAHKDLYLTEGVRTTAASKVLESYIPQYSATVVKRLEEAGCIMIGKTNCDAWAHGASGENSDFGPTLNPWNKEYVPGGSSSGSAAAVSLNLSLIATGTDTGGSIRQPASFCNVVGLKPTYGAVSRYGVIAMASSLDCMGHFTHTAEDSEKVFNVIKGQDGHDGTVMSINDKPPAVKNLRIGLPKEYFTEGLDREVQKLVMKVAKTFKNEGIEPVEISLPHTKYAISVYYIIQTAEVSSNLGRYDGIRYGNGRNSFGAEAKRRIMLGTYVLSSGYYDAYYLKAQKVRSKIIEDFENVFNPAVGGVDAILAPVSPTPPFKIGENTSDPLTMYLSDIYTVAASLAGLPGLAVPCGFTEKGLPIGFQLLGARFSEQKLFNLAKLYQKNTNWHKKMPQI